MSNVVRDLYTQFPPGKDAHKPLALLIKEDVIFNMFILIEKVHNLVFRKHRNEKEME